jgi:hypothetical protein
MNDAIDEEPAHGPLDTLCLGAVQRHRLLQLTRRYCGTVLWDGISAVTAPAVSVVVLNPATAPRIETLIDSLHENSIVVIPFGENPTFDFLKSKLYGYGSIGSQGAAAPHHIWWGGVKPLPVPTGLYRKEDTLFVSTFKPGLLLEDKAERLAASLRRLGLDGAVAPDTTTAVPGSSKVDFIIRQWEQAHRPVFWIAPDAHVLAHPVLPQSLGCDFAVHKQRSGEMETGVLFFHQTESARALLDAWQFLGCSRPDLPEAFLLDQAWTLASSQRQIETAWLPDSYWQAGEPPPGNRATVIQYDPSGGAHAPGEYLALRFQRGRRFGRHQAPEAHLIMQSPAPTRRPITVLVRDVRAGTAQSVSGAVEAIAQAFAADPGGFSQMEVVLCAWDDDVDAVLQIEDDAWVLVTDPTERLEPNAFSVLGLSAAIRMGSPVRQFQSPGQAHSAQSIFRPADPSPGDRMKRSGKYDASFLRRPRFGAHDE